MRCPQCGLALEGPRTVCAGCGGMFVTEQELNAMLSEMDAARDPLDRRTIDSWPIGTESSPRACPVCAQPMRRVDMDRVPVERCGAHGVWFDAGELQRTLSPGVDEESFSRDYERRQAIADSYEYGQMPMLAELVRAVWRSMRRIRRNR